MKTDINERIAFESKTKEYREGVLTGLAWALDRSKLVRSCYNSNALHLQARGITEIIYELKKMRKVVQVEEERSLALTECGEDGCKNLIGDWQDDVGGFYKNTAGGYVPVCKTCCGPLRGER